MTDVSAEYAKDVANFLTSVVWMEDRGATLDTDLLAEGLLDSLGIMQLVVFFEERWGICVGSDEIAPRNFRSISAIAKFVSGRAGNP